MLVVCRGNTVRKDFGYGSVAVEPAGATMPPLSIVDLFDRIDRVREAGRTLGRGLISP